MTEQEKVQKDDGWTGPLEENVERFLNGLKKQAATLEFDCWVMQQEIDFALEQIRQYKDAENERCAMYQMGADFTDPFEGD
jgi:hypothetical protein